MFEREPKAGAAFLTDATGKISTWNAACQQLFGFDAVDVLQEPVARLLAPTSRHDFEQRWPQLWPQTADRLQLEIARADGKTSALELTLLPQHEGAGVFKGSVVFLAALPEPDTETARVGKMPLSAVMNVFPGMFCVLNQAGRLVLWNKKLELVTQRNAQELAAINVQQMFEGPDCELIEAKVREVFSGAEVLVEASLVRKNGEAVPFLFSGTRITSGDTLYMCGVAFDLSPMRAQEEQLRLRERALHAANNGIIITRYGGKDNPIEYVNPAFERITGYKADEVIGRDARFMAAPGLDANERAQLRAAIDERREVNVVFRNQRKDGSLFWNDLAITPVLDANGAITHFIGVFNDVTAIKQRTAHLEHAVNHDPLTGLANRNLLWDRLEQALHLAQRNKSLVATVLIDLNNFKLINDTFGHEAGDEVLKMVAKRLQASVRDSDTVARMSGDEFVLVLVNQPSVRYTLRMIERLRSHLSAPVNFKGKEIPVGASMGVSVFPHDGATVIELVRAADVAMYHAKAARSDAVHFFSPDMKSTTDAKQKLEHEMQDALDKGQMFLLYQPKLDLKSGRIAGVEALLRWRHPEHGVMLPVSFLAEAEENGMIIPFGNWVLDQACAFSQQLQQHGHADVTVAVNTSYREYSQNNFIAHIGERLSRYKLPPSALELELREEVLIRNPDLGREVAAQMRAQGLKLSIDEFGDGLSDLAYLQQLPVSHLNISKSVVHAITPDGRNGAMAKTLIDIGHNLDMAVIGEAVETQYQMDFLKANGCDGLQGFRVSEPLGADALLQMLPAKPRERR
jgi:diguanylate cyclase (GGDEF)-like protein/PAS domain S-box-containing protein